MSHRIPVPVTKTRHIRSPGIDADAHITCFPTGRVEYQIGIIRVNTGEIYKIELNAIFIVQGIRRNLSKKASFFSNRNAAVGVPTGNLPFTGSSLPSVSAIHQVDDFEVSAGAIRMRNR